MDETIKRNLDEAVARFLAELELNQNDDLTLRNTSNLNHLTDQMVGGRKMAEWATEQDRKNKEKRAAQQRQEEQRLAAEAREKRKQELLNQLADKLVDQEEQEKNNGRE